MKNVPLKPVCFEPARSNRFIVNVVGAEVEEYLFIGYKIFNDGDDLIIETSFRENVPFTFNPKDFFKITGIHIKNIDPIGDVYSVLKLPIKKSNYEKECSYNMSNELTINKLKCVIDSDNISLEYTTLSEENDDKK